MRFTLAKARLDVREAEVSLAAAQDARTELDEGPDATDLAAAQADVDKKRLAVQDAEVALAGTQLTAPFDGTILQTNVNPGDSIAANTQILTLADLQQLQVLASVDETTIRRVAAGQPAQITFDALPGQTLTGQVGEVPLQGSSAGRRHGLRSAHQCRRRPEPAPAHRHDRQRQDPDRPGHKRPADSQHGLAEGQRLYQVLVPTRPTQQPSRRPCRSRSGSATATYTQIVRGLNDGDQVVVQMSSPTTITSSAASV